jgi:riboflavin synthase
VTTSAASPERRRKLEAKGVRVEVFEGASGRASLRATVEFLAREKYLSLMIEAGSRLNWSALESGVVDKIFFYYAPKILGGTLSLPVAGGAGRRRRDDAIVFREGDLTEGASIAVNGVCLTATSLTHHSFAADLAPETLMRSNLGDLAQGSRVNLERSVTPATRLSGHIVQGHVDATGELLSLNPLGDGNYWLTIRVPPELDRYLVHKGSIAIDGISLTIASLETPPVEVTDDGLITAEGPLLGVTIIPHTFANTRLGSLKPGARVNLEVDVIAKHIEKLIALRER